MLIPEEVTSNMPIILMAITKIRLIKKDLPN